MIDTPEIEAYPSERGLLENVGLPTRWPEPKDGGWAELGVVTLHDAEPDRDAAATTIKVEVVCAPAKFWRFTVNRPPDVVDRTIDNVEAVAVKTGSGGFDTYWPAAVMVAEHMLIVEPATG